MKIIKIVMSILCVGVVFNINTQPISANTLNDLYSQLKTLEEQVNNTATKKVLTKDEIAKKESEVITLQDQITTKSTEVNNLNEEILTLKEQVDKKSLEIEELLVFYQLNKEANQELSFIINGDSIVDSIHRTNTVTTFTKENDRKIKEYNELNKELDTKLEESKNEVSNLETLNNNLNSTIAELNGNLDGLNSQEFTATEKIALLKEDINYYESIGCSSTEDLSNCVARNFPPPPSVAPNPVPPPVDPPQTGEIPAPPPTNTNGFIKPITEGYVTSEWGVRLGLYGDFHSGIDLSIRGNPPIYASASGIVSSSGYATYPGYYVAINHTINGQKYSTVYAHMAYPPLVSKGDRVNVNTQLGNMGTTGASTGDHVHFQISDGWIFVDYYSMTQNTFNPRIMIDFPETWGYFYGR